MKSLISAKHGHCGQRTTSALMAKKAGCVTKRILWCPALGGVLTCSALCDISYNGHHPHRTDTVSPRSQGPELRYSPGLTGWVCCLICFTGCGPPCSTSAGTRGTTKSQAPQRKCECRLLRRERKVQTDHCRAEASCLRTATDRKLNLLSWA